jgi:hypothetical protein
MEKPMQFLGKVKAANRSPKKVHKNPPSINDCCSYFFFSNLSVVKLTLLFVCCIRVSGWIVPASFKLMKRPSAVTLNLQRISRTMWKENAYNFQTQLRNLIYPHGPCINASLHAVKISPVYNFLHIYYDFSGQYLSKYSSGFGCLLEDISQSDIEINVLHPSFLTSETSSEGLILPHLHR